MEEMIKVFKGTDKDMKCRGMQYELGETKTDDGAVRCGNKGFHSCEAPFDVLKYYPMRDGNRFFEAEAGGIIDRSGADDSKLASSELTLKAEIGLPGLIKAQVAYTRKKAESGTAGGYSSNLAGGNWSNLAGGDRSNLAGGDRSNLAGGNWSNLAGGNWSNLAGGYSSNLAGGNWSNLAGGNWSNLAGGESSVFVCRNGCKVKGGKNSVIVFTDWEWRGDEYVSTCVKTVIVDGEKIKADTWYTLKNGEIVEAE